VVHPEADRANVRPLLTREPAAFAGLAPGARLELLAAAARHGLLASVSGRLSPDDAELRTRFTRLAAGVRLNDERLRDVLEEVLAALASAGVGPVALKGPVLADRLYQDPGLRSSTDLDLLVAEAELDRSMAALLGLGFHGGPFLVAAYERRRLHHVHLVRTPGPDVELHFRPQSAFGALLPPEDFLARAVPHHTARGTPLRILSPEDELLVLAVHAAGHVLARGAWVLDLLLFLEHHPDLDWRLVQERASVYRCRRALAWTLGHLRELGAAVPPGPLLALDPVRRRLAPAIARAFAAQRGRRAGALFIAFQLLLSDRPWTAPGRILIEAGWVLRRRAHLLARALTRFRGAVRGPR
jgi:hypothetical protein